jgi:hypothetical protein
MTKILYSLFFLAALRADDSVETRLAQPLLNSKQTMVEARSTWLRGEAHADSRSDQWEKSADLRPDNVVFRGEAAKYGPFR